MADPASRVRAGSDGTSVYSELRENSVKIVDHTFSALDVLGAAVEDIGVENILGCVKVGGEWVLTIKSKSDAELLQNTGLVIAGKPCDVRGVTKSLITVSLFGVPAFISDEELSEKLVAYGCAMKSEWTHKTYEEHPTVENGIRYARIELPSNKKSLPYSILVSGSHLRLKHNGQTRVCNLCLGENHLMRECAQYVCKECNQQGHSENKCPKVKCYKCQGRGHKSFHCEAKDSDATKMEEGSQNDHSVNPQTTGAVPDPPPCTDPTESVEPESTNTEKTLSKSSPTQPEEKEETSTSSPINTTAEVDTVSETGKRGRESSGEELSVNETTWQVVRTKQNKKKFVPNTSTARLFTPANR